MKTKIIQMALVSGIFCLISFNSFSQQRTILLEEYTGRGCGPCGMSNPAFDTKCNANFPNKVVVIKYEEYSGTWTPPDLLPTADGKVRKAYYNSSSAPMVTIDGNYKTYHIDNLSQTEINTRCAVASPFNITISYNYNAAYDSITVSMKVTAVQTFNASGALYARIALTERLINYSVPMTPNGEMFFHHVFRKMLPDATGYSLPATWTNGQFETINIHEKLPTNIFNLGELELVAFVQDDGTKEVKQAAYSAPKIFPDDAGLDTIKNIPAFQCNLNAITPSVTIRNNGSAILSNAVIKYQIDNGTLQSQNWAGTLAAGATEEVNLAVTTPTNGRHILKAYTTLPNGAADKSVYNDTVIYKYSTLNTFRNTAFVEEFAQTTTNPFAVKAPDFAVDDQDLDQITFQSIKHSSYGSSFGVGEGTVYINYFRQINPNQFKIDHLYFPAIDLSGAAAANFIFDHAYAQYAATDNTVTLKVQVSSDCGNSWSELFNKKSTELYTAPPITTFFIPSSTEWKHNSINLNAYLGQSKVLIRMEVTSTHFENRLFLDKLGLAFTTDIESGNNQNARFAVYPNPFKNATNLSINLKNTGNVAIKIYNSLGAVVYENNGRMQAGTNSLLINSESWSSGFYFVKMETEGYLITKKIVVAEKR